MIKQFIFAWKKAFDFKGKTSRRDFWLYQLTTFLLTLLISFLENLATNIQYALLPDEDVYEYSIFVDILAVVGQLLSIISWLFLLGSFVVGISIAIRRLRDISKNWKWIFLNLIPIFGQIYFYIYFMTRPSTIISRVEKSEKMEEKKNMSRKLKKTTNKEIKKIEKNEIPKLTEELEKLAALKEKGILTEEEFKNAKSKLIN